MRCTVLRAASEGGYLSEVAQPRERNGIPSRRNRKCRVSLGGTVGRGEGWMVALGLGQGAGAPPETSHKEGPEVSEVGKQTKAGSERPSPHKASSPGAP